jgi:hypothetical protein
LRKFEKNYQKLLDTVTLMCITRSLQKLLWNEKLQLLKMISEHWFYFNACLKMILTGESILWSSIATHKVGLILGYPFWLKFVNSMKVNRQTATKALVEIECRREGKGRTHLFAHSMSHCLWLHLHERKAKKYSRQ